MLPEPFWEKFKKGTQIEWFPVYRLKTIKNTNHSEGVSVRSKGSLQDTVGLKNSIPRKEEHEGVHTLEKVWFSHQVTEFNSSAKPEQV